jgi:hypothetical protein
MISWKSVVYTIIMCCILLSVGCLSTASDYPKFLSSKYEYILEITTTDPLYNATFYLPIPVKNDMPMVGNKLLNPMDFEREGYTISFTRIPPDFSPQSGEYQISGNDPWFVRINADIWPNGSYRVELYNETHDVESPMLFIDTLHPIGNESIILPKWSFSPQQPMRRPLGNPLSDFIQYSSNKNKQTTWIYSNYSTKSNPVVTIGIQMKGINQWLNDYDSWAINEYNDFFFGGISGEQGEHLLNGEFTVADGYYPDLSSSKWQQFMKRNSQGS